MLREIKRKIRHLLGIRSSTDFYNQAGEDAIVMNTFNYLFPKTKGFYIDVGAYHPYKHSNAYMLFKAGWRGINIDPRPGSKKLFDHYRKEDINIEAGVGANNSTMTYYMIDEKSTMNTFSRENLENLGIYKDVKARIEIPVYTLSSLLDKIKCTTQIDYLNIDAEGFEMQILSGIDFSNVKPSVISIEKNNVFSLQDVIDSEVNKYLSGKGYIAYAKNLILGMIATVFYAQKDFLKK